ncbi:MAG TPA: RidA family protein [Anaerolineaceae bacterium]|nr:RidA family protein [Anaerolineaceae bacterium]HQN04531.1 RidA family protein [Anaerolineaceae bacterium]HQP08097.1 RidA family protein [Anaerolineaceae bacterium]
MACSHQKHIIKAPAAPKPIGPYSAAVKAGPFLFCSGQLGLVPETGNIIEGGIEEETRQACKNIKNVLEAAGSSLENVVKTTVFLRDMNEFAKMNTVYGEFFSGQSPARSAVQVAALPKFAAVEIEVIALAAGE